MKQTSQRSLLFRQNVNRTEAEWVHFLDGYRKALIEFDMKKFSDDWHTAEDIVEEIFLNIVRESRITALRPQDSFRHVLINMCMQKHKSFTKPWRRRLAERLSVALCLTMRTQDDARREIAAGVRLAAERWTDRSDWAKEIVYMANLIDCACHRRDEGRLRALRDEHGRIWRLRSREGGRIDSLAKMPRF